MPLEVTNREIGAILYSINLRIPMAKINFQEDGLEVVAKSGSNLRDIALKEGASIPFGCEQGICGTCLIEVPEGAENLTAPEEQETETLEAMGAEPGQRLACQCQAKSDVTIVGAL